jgi:hypothetical protein
VLVTLVNREVCSSLLSPEFSDLHTGGNPMKTSKNKTGKTSKKEAATIRKIVLVEDPLTEMADEAVLFRLALVWKDENARRDSAKLINTGQLTLSKSEWFALVAIERLCTHGIARSEHVSVDELAKFLDISVGSIRRMHAAGAAPPRIRRSRRWMYPVNGVLAWLPGYLPHDASQTANSKVPSNAHNVTFH